MRARHWLVTTALTSAALLGAVTLSTPATAAAPTVTPMVRVMPLGDSITWGVGSSTTSSYRADLWRRLVEQSGYGVDFVGSGASGSLPDRDNEGHSGWTISQVAAQTNGWLSTYRPDVVLLHIGTNNMYSDADAQRAPGQLSALIDQIHVAPSSPRLFVAQIVPAKDNTINARITAFNRQLPAIVASKDSSKISLVDLYSPLNRSGDLADNLHPSDAGYVKMAATWDTAARPVLPVPRALASLGKCLEGRSATNGAAVQIWSCNGGPNQRISRQGETLRSFGRCLDVSGAATANGSKVVLWTCNGGTNQNWQLRSDGSIFNPRSGRCLDVQARNTTDGTQLVIWDCSGGTNQQWVTV